METAKAVIESKRFMRRESCWVPHWREEDGVIYSSVTSDGTTGEDWITRLECDGFYVADGAKKLLRSSDFKPTSGITTEIAILVGDYISDGDLTTKKIYAEADKRRFEKPNAEVTCLIREIFMDKEIRHMRLNQIVVVHEPINIDLVLFLLDVYGDTNCSFLGISRANPYTTWNRCCGFAFAVSSSCA